MEIEIANIAYISNRPENSPNRESSLFENQSTHQPHSTGSDTRATTSQTDGITINPPKKETVKKTLHPHQNPLLKENEDVPNTPIMTTTKPHLITM